MIEKYQLIKLEYRYKLYHVIVVSCSTLLGVLIALQPQEFRPTEARLLYLYCCLAVALCILLAGIVLVVLLKYTDQLQKPRRATPDLTEHIEYQSEPYTLEATCYALSYVLSFAIVVVFALLFLLLSLRLELYYEWIMEAIPLIPSVVIYTFVAVTVSGVMIFFYKIWRANRKNKKGTTPPDDAPPSALSPHKVRYSPLKRAIYKALSLLCRKLKEDNKRVYTSPERSGATGGEESTPRPKEPDHLSGR